MNPRRTSLPVSNQFRWLAGGMAAELSVKELKALCQAHGVSIVGCAEKGDLVRLVNAHDLLAAPPPSASSSAPPPPTTSSSTAASASPPPSASSVKWHTRTEATLAGRPCHIVPHGMSEGGAKPDLVVLLFHGFGASADGYIPLAAHLAPQLGGKRAVFIMPQAQDSAWWPIDFIRFGASLMGGSGGIARAIREPVPGMPAATEFVHALIAEVSGVWGLSTSDFVLGGFSQGAILSVNSGLRLPESPKAIVSLSGLPLTVEEWASEAARHKGLRVFQSHGKADMLLPYVSSGWLSMLLNNSGLEVQFETHDGGHDVGGAEVLDKLGKFLASLD